MMITRRTLLQAASAAAALGCLPRMGAALPASSILVRSGPRLNDPDMHALAQQAVDAAITAGASYADARLTIGRDQEINEAEVRSDAERRGFGVRVLVNGYWGFMGSVVWTPDEANRLARGAVAQAKANGVGRVREIELGTIPRVERGVWRMPVKYDPFDVPFREKFDVLLELVSAARRYSRFTNASVNARFLKQQKIWASSDGSSWDQTTYGVGGLMSAQYHGQYSLKVDMAMSGFPSAMPFTGQGWEYFCESDLPDRMPGIVETVGQMRYRVPVDVDRCDVVFSAQAISSLVDGTIGAATELDRALGYTANAGGTSYLNDPLEMLGALKLGTDKLTVTADRSTPHGMATVKWDDDGVEPEAFSLVEQGTLTDFQTTRDQAAWLAPYYNKIGRPVRSHGCANAQSALFITTQHAPNLRLRPGADDIGFDDLVKDTKRGVAVLFGGARMDHQQRNGLILPTMRQIRDGKLGPFIEGGAIPFRSADIWKNLLAIGGQASEEWYGTGRQRGQPQQSTYHSVGAVPAKIKDCDIIDVRRSGGTV